MSSKLFIMSILTMCVAGCTPSTSMAQESTSEAPKKLTPDAPVHVTTQDEARQDIEDAEDDAYPVSVDQSSLRKRYPWLEYTDGLADLTTLDRLIPTPDGYTRQEVDKDSYAHYLRGLPVRTDRKDVLLYNGDPVSMPSAGVIPLDLGKRDLHQCADSVIRLYSEYLWSVDRASEAEFHYTSGDLARWKDWRKGKVLKVKGNKVVQVNSKKSPHTHKAYRSWLDRVFMYASTRSLHKDSTRIKLAGDLQAGDFFLQGGSPGHVIMILDVAQNPDGARIALLGQGYLPAREFHVISGEGSDVVDGAWYVLSDTGSLATPTWKPFGMDDAWRFN